MRAHIIKALHQDNEQHKAMDGMDITLVRIDKKNKIVITLEDNGCGIPHVNLDRVFEPFFTTKPHGLGLGLMNARNIVEEHNGTIQVNSKMGSGTTFVIELPIGET